MKKSKEIINPTPFFRILSIIWTLVCMALVVLEFLQIQFIPTEHQIQVTFTGVALYLTVLGIYVAAIQRRKWHGLEKDGIRKGELYFYSWWVLALIFKILNSITGWPFPEMFFEIISGVTLIFAGGKVCKYVRLAKKKK